MRISRRVRFVEFFLIGVSLCAGGCVSLSKPPPDAKTQAGALSHFSLGLMADSRRDSGAAHEHFLTALRLNPQADELYAPAIASALAVGKTDEALRLAKKQIQRNPEALQSQLLLAKVYSLTGSPDAAETLLKKLQTDFPADPETPVLLVRLYLSQNRLSDAEAALKIAAAAQPQNADVLFLLGTLCLERARIPGDTARVQESLQEGVRFLKQALELYPENGPGWRQLGFAQLALNQSAEALVTFQKARELLPSDLHLARQVLDLLLYEKLYDEAVAACEQLAEDTGTDLESWHQYLARALPKEELHRLIRTVETYIDGIPKPPAPRFVQLGQLYLSTGQQEKAAPLILKAIELYPEEVNLRILLGYLMMLYSEQKQYPQALETARQFETLCITNNTTNLLNAPFYYQYASLHERTGKLDEAEKFFRTVMDSDDPQLAAAAQNYLAYMRAERGENLEEGLTLIQKALKVDPENGAFLDTLGWIYYRLGRYNDALRELKKAVELTENDPVVLEHLGDTYLKLNQRESAVEQWKKALEIDPVANRLIEKMKTHQPAD